MRFTFRSQIVKMTYETHDVESRDRDGIIRLEMEAESEKERFILLTLVEFYESLRDGEAGFCSRPLSIYNAELGS